MQPILRNFSIEKGDAVNVVFLLTQLAPTGSVPLDPAGSVFELVVSWPGGSITRSTADGTLTLTVGGAATQVKWALSEEETASLPLGGTTYAFARITPGGGRRTYATGAVRAMPWGVSGPGDIGIGISTNAGEPIIALEVTDYGVISASTDTAVAASQSAAQSRNAAAGSETRAAQAAAAAVTTGRVYDTLAQLQADLSPAAGVGGQVVNDGANSGLYVKTGAAGSGGWSLVSRLTLPGLANDLNGKLDPATVFALGGEATVARSSRDRFAERINILDFGASLLNSAAQNSAAIQKAFDAAASDGRDVFVPPGKFDHNGLTWKAASRLYGCGQASRLNYTGTGIGIAIADGANDFCFGPLRLSMAGDGSAIKFTGTNLRYEFANLVIDFPAYLGTVARRGFDYNLASGKYTAFAKFRTLRVFSAGRGIYVDPASSEVNNVDLDNVEFGACTRAVDARPAFSSGWTIKGGSAEVASDGETQWVFDNFHGVTMVGVRTETKNSGGWAAQVVGAYTSHSPVHFGPGCQKTAVIEPVFFPHTANVYFHEGIRKVYIHGQDGVITDAPLQAGSGAFGSVSGSTATFTGALSAAAGTFTGAMERRGAAGTNRLFNWTTGGVLRASFGLGTGAESGSNAGSDFAFNTYSDAGAYLATPFTITRATGVFSIFNGLSLSGLVNAVNDAGAAAAGVPVGRVYRSGSALMIRAS